MIRRDLFLAMFGIGAGQIILLAAMPFLARAYGPSAFGSYSVVIAVAGVVSIVAALRLDLAISSAEGNDVAALTRVSLVLPLVVVPFALALLAGALALPWGTALPFDKSALPLIGLVALFQSLVLVGTGLSTRRGAFPIVAAMKIVQPLIFALTALFVIHELSLSMVVGWIAALLVSLASLRNITLTRGWRESCAAVQRMWRFPAISTPMALLDTLALALPLLVIAASFGDQAAGNYAQVQRLMGAPLVLVATAGSQVFSKYAGDRIRAAGSVMPLVRRFVLWMVGLAVLIIVFVGLLGQPILLMLIGDDWRTDTGFLVLTLLPVICRVIASPVSSVLILTHRITALGTWQICYFVITSATLLAGSRWLPLDGLLVALAVSEFLLYGAYLALSVHAARQTGRQPAGSPVPAQ